MLINVVAMDMLKTKIPPGNSKDYSPITVELRNKLCKFRTISYLEPEIPVEYHKQSFKVPL